MKRNSIVAWLLVLLFSVTVTFAQDDTDTDTTATDADTVTEPDTTVEYFFVACQDVGVVNLSGTAQPGFDIFYQIFSGPNGTGDALTSLRRINASGDYNFSERIPYANNLLVAPGATASARILIADINTPENPAFDTFVDDLQDGCNDAQNDLQVSDSAGNDPAVTTTTTTKTTSAGIASPDGGILDTGFDEQPAVVLGPRDPNSGARSSSPGLVFAQCNAYPSTIPGVVYDSEPVRVFWYWFARTQPTLEQNLSRTRYDIKINGASASLDQLATSVDQRSRSVYQFFTLPIGNLRPGFYQIDFNQTWTEAINDGYDDYGPGTANPVVNTSCNFEVTRNPFGITDILYSGLYIGSDTPLRSDRDVIQQQVLDDLAAAAGN